MTIKKELLNADLIFHYTSAQTALEHILKTGDIRFSPMKEMNDPYEYQMPSSGGIVPSNYDKKRRLAHTLFLREAALTRSKTACFSIAQSESDDPFSRPYAKPRNWAQYGDAQRGVCLAFDKNKLIENLHEQLDEVAIYEGNVNYNLGNGLASTKSLVHDDEKLSIEESIYRHLDLNKTDAYFRKHADFKDEAEYRIVVLDKAKTALQYRFCPIHGALKYIVLGDRFNKMYFDLMLQLAAKYSARVLALRYGNVPYINELPNTPGSDQ